MSFLDKLQTRVKQQADRAQVQTDKAIKMIATTSSLQQSQRMEICKSCEHLTERLRRCRMCGCFMDAKTWLADQECPIGKWHKINQS